MEKPKLQVALDNLTIEDALHSMRNGLERVVDIIEAGTYLILMEGVRAVRILRSAFPDNLIVADYNGVDPAFESLILEQGAQLNTVNSVMPDEMLRTCLENARARGQSIQICLYDDRLDFAAAQRWREMGAEYFVYTNYHDEWLASDVENVRRLCGMGYHVSIADGVTAETLELFRGVPLYAIVMGGAIRKAADPVAAAAALQKKITEIWGNSYVG